MQKLDKKLNILKQSKLRKPLQNNKNNIGNLTSKIINFRFLIRSWRKYCEKHQIS
jgi:hypothetical protein